jgi:hypothetical protein
MTAPTQGNAEDIRAKTARRGSYLTEVRWPRRLRLSGLDLDVEGARTPRLGRLSRSNASSIRRTSAASTCEVNTREIFVPSESSSCAAALAPDARVWQLRAGTNAQVKRTTSLTSDNRWI